MHVTKNVELQPRAVVQVPRQVNRADVQILIGQADPVSHTFWRPVCHEHVDVARRVDEPVAVAIPEGPPLEIRDPWRAVKLFATYHARSINQVVGANCFDHAFGKMIVAGMADVEAEVMIAGYNYFIAV